MINRNEICLFIYFTRTSVASILLEGNGSYGNQGKPMTIRSFVQDLPSYGRAEMKPTWADFTATALLRYCYAITLR